MGRIFYQYKLIIINSTSERKPIYFAKYDSNMMYFDVGLSSAFERVKISRLKPDVTYTFIIFPFSYTAEGRVTGFEWVNCFALLSYW